MQKHIIKIKKNNIKQDETNWTDFHSQFKDQVKHDFISWYLSTF